MRKKGKRGHREGFWSKAVVLSAGLLIAVGPASAHQPRWVGDKPSTIVLNPEISQAFYARLNGGHQSYYIKSDKPFRLYLNLLVPDLPGIDKDYQAVVYKTEETPGNVLTRLDGPSYAWRPFYEPFGGDRYFLGPEYEADVPGGAYVVVVSSPDLQGRYALAVGKIEKFTLGEMVRTIGLLPKLKKEFFDKSPLSAFFNLSGAFLLVVAGGLVGLAALFF
jgi:hypothetical protein